VFNSSRTINTGGVQVTFPKDDIKAAQTRIGQALIDQAELPKAIEFIEAQGMYSPRLAITLYDITASVLNWGATNEAATAQLNNLAAGGIEVFKGTVGDDETLVFPISFHFPHRIPRTTTATVSNTIAGIKGLTKLIPLLNQDGEMQEALRSGTLPTLLPEGGTNLNDALYAVGHVIEMWLKNLAEKGITPETVELLIFTDGHDVRSLINLDDLKDLFKRIRKIGEIRVTLFGIQTGRDKSEQSTIKRALDQLSKAISATFAWAGENLQEVLDFARMSQLDPEGLAAAVKVQHEQGILPDGNGNGSAEPELRETTLVEGAES